jgi:hypothetical protein
VYESRFSTRKKRRPKSGQNRNEKAIDKIESAPTSFLTRAEREQQEIESSTRDTEKCVSTATDRLLPKV